MKASDLFVKCLEKEGVRYVFGLPGEEIEDLLFSLKNSSIRFIPTRHEQGAAFMADVWGRLSGKAGVCLSTLGPGATNLLTGVADAYLDKSPVVSISGQAGLKRMHQDSHQYVDIEALFKPVTKWTATIVDPSIVPEVVRKAFKLAEEEKPGSTQIIFPEDIAHMRTRAEPIHSVPIRRPDPDVKALREAAYLLKKAKRPLVITGNGSVRKDSRAELLTLVERNNIPFVNTFMGQGSLPDDMDQSLFTLGLGFRDIVMDAVDRADVVLAVGYDIAEFSPDRWNPRKNKTIIHIDFSPADVYAHYQPALEIVADITASLRELNRILAFSLLQPFESGWYKTVRKQIIRDLKSYDLVPGRRFTIPGVLNVLREVMDRDGLLISDVGSHKMWIARNYPVYNPNGCLISNGLASMGFALPGAIAACLYCPDKPVVAAMGDGGFLMNSQELETAKRLKVGFTTLIFNDNDYGLISWKQKMDHGISTGTRITNPDFKKYAQSFGIRAYRPKNVQELRRQLKRAVESRQLCVFDIPVDAGVNQALSKKLKSRTSQRR